MSRSRSRQSSIVSLRIRQNQTRGVHEKEIGLRPHTFAGTQEFVEQAEHAPAKSPSRQEELSLCALAPLRERRNSLTKRNVLPERRQFAKKNSLCALAPLRERRNSLTKRNVLPQRRQFAKKNMLPQSRQAAKKNSHLCALAPLRERRNSLTKRNVLPQRRQFAKKNSLCALAPLRGRKNSLTKRNVLPQRRQVRAHEEPARREIFGKIRSELQCFREIRSTIP